MGELKEYYEQWKRNLLWICISIGIIMSILFFKLSNYLVEGLQNIINNDTLPYINSENEVVFKFFLQYFLGLFTPGGIVFFIYTKVLKYINEDAWKKRFPNYNIDGKWDDISEYTGEFSKNGYKALKGKKVPSPVIIKQTCEDIKIESSVGKDFTWESLMAFLDGQRLKIFYKVEYKNSLQIDGYPEYRIGYEEMVIDMSNLSRNQKPNKLSGQFWHCVQNDSKPMYMGDVIYRRN